MKILPLLFALVLPISARAAGGPLGDSLDVGRMSAVLRSMENGPKSDPWQITDAVWNRYSKQKKTRADEYEHQRVAWQFLSECARQAVHLDLPITPYNVASLWRAGYGAVQGHSMTKAEKFFAERASNLYNDKSFKP